MIGIKLNGRMGNQLFQFAYAYMLCMKIKKPFFLDENTDSFHASKYFLFPRYNKFKNWLLCMYYRQNQSNFKHFSQKDLKSENKSYYSGYFQSLDYFKSVSGDLKKKVTIKRKYRLAFNKKYSELIKSKYVAIHVRKKDYTSIGNLEGNPKDVSLPTSYFKTCLSKIENINNYRIVFVSDDIEWIKNNFQEYTNAKFFSDSEIMDFLILKNASKVVISNSTFSWWAAFLNQNCDEVFAPKFWMGYNEKDWGKHHSIYNQLNWQIIYG